MSASSNPTQPVVRELQPALSFPPELLLKAQGPGLGLKAAIFDVDGVLTDGRIYIGEQGEDFKAFATLDGHGMKLLAQGGIVPIVITGRDSPAVRRRIADLGLPHAVYGAKNKLAAARRFFNNAVADYNGAIQSFPAVLVAGPLGFKPREFFDLGEADRAALGTAPAVSF